MFYYGDAASGQPDEVLVSFGYGSIAQCAANTTPGEISFGYDKALNCGAIFRSGELVSSRVLDLKLDTNSDGSKTVTVHYITNGGQVVSDSFAVADPSLVTAIAEQAALQAVPTEDVKSIKITLQGSDLIKSLSAPLSVTPVSEGDGYTSYAIQLNVDDNTLSVNDDGDLTANVLSYKLEKGATSDGKEVYTLKQTDKDGAVSDCGSITIGADKYLSSVTMVYAVIVDGQYIETADAETVGAVPCLKFTWNDETAQYIKMVGADSTEVALVGSTYITVPSDMKGAIELNYTDLFNKIKEDLANIGIGDHETVNTLQNKRLEKIEGGYVRAAEIEESEDGGKILKLTVASKESVSADEEVSTVEFAVSAAVDLSGLTTAISEMGQNVESIEARVSKIEQQKKEGWVDLKDLIASSGENGADDSDAE